MKTAELIATLHHIATGRAVTTDEALAYFREPLRLRHIIEESGCLDKSTERRRILDVLSKCEGEIKHFSHSQRRCA